MYRTAVSDKFILQPPRFSLTLLGMIVLALSCTSCSKYSLINRSSLSQENAELEKQAELATLSRKAAINRPNPIAGNPSSSNSQQEARIGVVTPAKTTNNISLGRHGGVFTIAGRLNDVLTLDFVVDSGAADVHIPADVASTLLRTHTINQGDFLPGAIYTMADGSKARSQRFIIRKLQVGNTIVRNVPAAIGNSKGDLLLGQSFLSRFPSWSIDNKSHRLILGGQEQ